MDRDLSGRPWPEVHDPDTAPREPPRPSGLRRAARILGLAATALTLVGAVFQLQRGHTSPTTIIQLETPKWTAVYGDLAISRPSGREVCTDEHRALPAVGRWHCTMWTRLGPNERALQAINPGGPCTERYAVEPTGEWNCLSTTASPPAAKPHG
jgi:hypothetical protein